MEERLDDSFSPLEVMVSLCFFRAKPSFETG
jgi:hypothetical protein